MKKNKKTGTQKVLLSAAVGAAAVYGAQAYDVTLSTNLPPVTFHGFASQGFLASSQYNYLGNTTDGSFKFTEVGVNASLNPFPRTRISVQGFTYDVGDVGDYDLMLDYAQAEYTFNDEIGIRAGRIRRPSGIYNHIQDVDLARTYVLLPQGVYDCRWRDFYVSLDGASLFGTIPLQKAGSLSYEVYGGYINPTMDGGVAHVLENQFPSYVTLDNMKACPEVGGQFWWNTPVDGLRVGASEVFVRPFNYDSTAYGVVHPNNKINVFAQQYSVEYLWEKWTFQSEYSMTTLMPEAAGQDNSAFDAWYIGSSYRFNKWFEPGMYYGEYYGDTGDRGNSLTFQKDLALAFRFDIKDWWIFKVEGHYLNGTGLIEDNAANAGKNYDARAWFMLAVKTTFSF